MMVFYWSMNKLKDIIKEFIIKRKAIKHSEIKIKLKMTSHKKLTIGLFGFGVVGEGLYKVLQQTSSLKCYYKKDMY